MDKSEEKKVSSESRNEGQVKTEERVKGSWTTGKGREEGEDVGKTSFLVWIRLTSWFRNEISEREGLM